MKYKVKSLYYIDYPIYNSLPSCDDELVCRIAACLYVRYRRIDSQSNLPKSKNDFVGRMVSYLCHKYYEPYHSVIISGGRSGGKNNFVGTCVDTAETQYMFKAIRLYEYLQTEVLSKARARRFTRHVVRKQIFGK